MLTTRPKTECFLGFVLSKSRTVNVIIQYYSSIMVKKCQKCKFSLPGEDFVQRNIVDINSSCRGCVCYMIKMQNYSRIGLTREETEN